MLGSADLQQAKLSGASFYEVSFGESNLTGAVISRTRFIDCDITAAQIYSTASYQNRDLRGIILYSGSLAGWNFAGQDLSQAELSGSLAGADFSGAIVAGARIGSMSAAQLYSTASYQARDLTGFTAGGAGLQGADLKYQNLRQANFATESLVQADLAGAHIQQAILTLTADQLYSTASFQSHDLTGVNLYGNLNGFNFTGQNLTGASLHWIGANTDLTEAIIEGATIPRGLTAAQLYSTASYQQKNLQGVRFFEQNMVNSTSNFRGWNFAGQNLADANLSWTDLTDADFTGAKIDGIQLWYANLTSEQLYATSSYQAGDLSRIYMSSANLDGWNFAGQNLSGARFSHCSLRGADLSGANLTNASFPAFIYDPELTLIGANLSGADARGAQWFTIPPTAQTNNLIRQDGTVRGLNLGSGETFVVRDYDGDPFYAAGPIAITVESGLETAGNSVLRVVLEDDAWNSTISFVAGIPVELGGTLELSFAEGVDPRTQAGRTFKLFDWTGVSPSGTFSVSSSHAWDLSKLYSTGEVRLLPVPEPTASMLGVLGLTLVWCGRGRRAG